MNAKKCRGFLDTNAAVYAYSISDILKQKKARRIILDCECIISTQVLNEFCNVGFKKLKLTTADILADIDDLLTKCSLVAVTPATIKKALDLHERHQFSYYDALIVASAIESHCEFLFTEDLHDGQAIESVTIRNIFGGHT